MQIFLVVADYFVRCYGRFARKHVDRRLRRFVVNMTNYFPFFVNVLLLPKETTRLRKPFGSYEDIAVIIQGPLIRKNNFTLETARRYRLAFPGAFIVASTWVDEDSELLEQLRAEGVHVVTSEKPPVAGASNINLQLVSTMAGLKVAEQLGVEFVLKTRTDCRLYASNVLGYLRGLIKLFPPAASAGMRGRLVALDYATRLYVPAHVADIIMFGCLEDMVRYWSAPLSDQSGRGRGKHAQLGEIWEESTPEVYLGKSFARRQGFSEIDSIENWWGYLKDCFVIVDRSNIGFFWSKYSISNESVLEGDFDARAMAIVSQRDWVCLATLQVNEKEIPSDVQHLSTKKGGGFVD